MIEIVLKTSHSPTSFALQGKKCPNQWACEENSSNESKENRVKAIFCFQSSNLRTRHIINHFQDWDKLCIMLHTKYERLYIKTSLQPVYMHGLFGKRFLNVDGHQNNKVD